MNRLITIALLGTMGCSLSTYNRVSLATAFTAVAIDAAQTLKLSNDGWRGSHEVGLPGVFFGDKPTVGQLAVYDVGIVVALIAVYTLTPERVRPVLLTPLIAEQGYVIYGNTQIPPLQGVPVVTRK